MSKQRGRSRIRPGKKFKVVLAFTNTLKRVLPSMDVAIALPGSVTLRRCPMKMYMHQRPTVENGNVLVRLNQIPGHGVAKIMLKLRAATSASGTLSFPYRVSVESQQCTYDGTAKVSGVGAVSPPTRGGRFLSHETDPYIPPPPHQVTVRSPKT